jgi:DNA-binding MarR family transcriptional regulator
METLGKFWPLIYSIISEFWEITEPSIEDAAIANDIPIELYYYSELGLETFSVENFFYRDPFTNPEQFEKTFARFDVKGWIFPLPDEEYQVSRKAQDAVRQIINIGNEQLVGFKSLTEDELKQMLTILKQVTNANLEAPEPPEKWAIVKRFRVATMQSPLIVQVKEYLLDLFAYRDDSHLSAAYPYFGQAGIVWSVLGYIAKGIAVSAKQMAEVMTFRGYDVEDYEVTIQAAVELGWVEPSSVQDAYRVTEKGREIREEVDRLTDEYFYRPWSVLSEKDVDTLYGLLKKLHEQLVVYKRSGASGSRI